MQKPENMFSIPLKDISKALTGLYDINNYPNT